MSVIKDVNPFRCRMWKLHDRVEDYLSEENCRAEIGSFLRNGQLVPVLGRALPGDPDHDIELIYGARRLFVARHLNKPLTVELREVSDKEAIVAMDIENRHRSDISAYERGLSYARWLRSGCFQSQEEISQALKVSCSHVSRMLKLARLPTVVVSAFESPLHICEEWGLRLMELLDDPQRREATVRKARALGSRPRRPPAREVFRELLAASAPGRKVRARARDEVIKDDNGVPLFRLRQQRDSVALVIPLERLSVGHLEELCQILTKVLQSNRTKDYVAASGRTKFSLRAMSNDP